MGRFGIIFCVVLLGGCSSPKIHSYQIYEDPTTFVRLEFDPTKDAVGYFGFTEPDRLENLNDHPASVSIEKMTAVLEGLLIQEQYSPYQKWFWDDPVPEPALRKKEISFLVPQLVDGLSRAVPEEWVTFYVSYPLNSITREVTSGSLYMARGKLHLLLSNRRTTYSVPAYGVVHDRQHPAHSLAPRNFDLTFIDLDPVVAAPKKKFYEYFFGSGGEEEIVLDLEKIKR